MAGLVLQIDPDGVLTGALKAKSALDTVVESARKTEAALIKAGDGGDALKRKFDPAYASALKLGKELDDLDRALKIGAVDAKTYAAEIGRMGQATARMGALSGQARGQIQQVSYQVGDFAVQVGAGTSAAQALGQQLPQLLGAFGPLGAVMGVVAAIGVPLGAAFFSSGTAAVTLTDQIDALSEATSNFQSSTEAAMAPLADITQRYGTMAVAAREALTAISQSDKIAAVNAMADTIKLVGDNLLVTREFANSDFLGGTESVRLLSDTFGLAGAAASDLTTALVDLENAKGVEAQANAALDVVYAIDAARDSAGQLPRPLEEARAEMARIAAEGAGIIGTTDAITGKTYDWVAALNNAASAAASIVSSGPTSGWLSGAIGDASTLASTLWGAAQAAAAARGGNIVNANASRGPSFDSGGRSGSTLAPAAKVMPTLDDIIARSAPKGGHGGGGGGRGGVSAADKAAQDYDRLIASLDPATKSANEFEKAQKTVNDALKVGAISANEAARAMDLAKEKYTEGGDAAKYWKDITGDMKESFIDLAVDGVKSFDDIARSIKRAAIEALLFKSGPLAGLFGARGGGGGLGGILGIGKSLFAGFFDEGGTIGRGQVGIVGENGPEIVKSTGAGAVVTSRAETSRQLSRGGGEMRVHVTTSIDNEGGVKNYVQNMAVQSAQAAVNQVKGSLAGWSNQLQTDGVIA